MTLTNEGKYDNGPGPKHIEKGDLCSIQGPEKWLWPSQKVAMPRPSLRLPITRGSNLRKPQTWPCITELRVGFPTPDLPLANEGKRILRVQRFKLSCQPVAVENRVHEMPRRIAVADPVDGLYLLLFPIGPSAQELVEERGVRYAHRHEDERVAIQIHQVARQATTPFALLHFVEFGGISIDVEQRKFVADVLMSPMVSHGFDFFLVHEAFVVRHFHGVERELYDVVHVGDQGHLLAEVRRQFGHRNAGKVAVAVQHHDFLPGDGLARHDLLWR